MSGLRWFCMAFTASTLFQHSHPGHCSSWRVPDLLWTQLTPRSPPENRCLPLLPLYRGQTGGSLKNSPKGSQLQLASLIIKYMLLGSVSRFEKENMVNCTSLWVHINPSKRNSCSLSSHHSLGVTVSLQMQWTKSRPHGPDGKDTNT